MSDFPAGDQWRELDRQIRTYIRKRLRSWQFVDDVVQETWLRLWRNREQHNGGAWEPWAMSTARFCLMDHYRKSRQPKRAKLWYQWKDGVDVAGPDTTLSVDYNDDVRWLADARRLLSAERNEAIELRIEQGLGWREIPCESTKKARLRAAITALRGLYR